MATVDESDVPQAGALGGRINEGFEQVSSTVYARRGGSLYPIGLVFLVALALAAEGLSRGLWDVVALASLALLAVWVGARG